MTGIYSVKGDEGNEKFEKKINARKPCALRWRCAWFWVVGRQYGKSFGKHGGRL
jgi:hypothetical protein